MTEIDLVGALVRWSDGSLGNLGHVPPRRDHDEFCCSDVVNSQRRVLHDRDWLYVTQTHGNGVVVVDEPYTQRGVEADAAVTATADVPLAIATADCAPIALACKEGIVGAVHAGWKGMQNGVIAAAAAAMRSLGATDIHAALGPCIHAECYEFSGDALDDLVEQFGDLVVGETRSGERALDMVATARVACEKADVKLDYVHDTCTACDVNYFSFRARKDEGRQVMLVWRPGQGA